MKDVDAIYETSEVYPPFTCKQKLTDMTSIELQKSINVTTQMGMYAECFVVEFEKKRLPNYLHPAIVHYAEKDVAMGYDILSFESPESLRPDRYIEVKTYRGHKHFYWSEAEVTMARFLSDRYFLYLVDYERIGETGYEPEIIATPIRLFDMKTKWLNQPTNYVFSELSPENIPQDWFSSIILLGCYKTQTHLQWILSNRCYNVRACNKETRSQHGEIHIDDPRIHQARYMLLYQIGAPQNFMLFELNSHTRIVSQDEIRKLNYANPHSQQYILHSIVKRLPDFYVNLQQLFREALPKLENAKVGQPLYLSGRQLANFMPQRIVGEKQADDSRYRNLMLEKRGTLWNEQEDNQLIAHLSTGLSLSEISSKMFRTKGSLKSRMKRLLAARLITLELYRKYIPAPSTVF